MNLGLLFAADLGFLLLEQAAVLLLGQVLFPALRTLWPAELGLFGLAAVLWTAAFLRLHPRQALFPAGPTPTVDTPPGGSSRPRSREQIAAAAYAAIRLPIDTWGLRIVLLTAQSALLGFYGVHRNGLPARSVAFLLWTAAFVTPLLDSWRALLYAQAGERFLTRLLATRLSLRIPVISSWDITYGYLRETYHNRLLLDSLALLGAAFFLSAVTIALSLPAVLTLFQGAGLIQLLFFAPPLGIALLAFGMVCFRRAARPLDREIAMQRHRLDPLNPDSAQPLFDNNSAARHVAARLPDWLVLGKLLTLGTAVFLLGAVAVYRWQAAPQVIGTILGQVLLCLLATAYLEWPWHKARMARLFPPAWTLAPRTRTQALLIGAALFSFGLYSALLMNWFWGLQRPTAPEFWRLLGQFAAFFFIMLLGLWGWLGRRLRPLRVLTVGATTLARRVRAMEHPGPDPSLSFIAATSARPLHEALNAMQKALHERLLSTTQAQTRLEAEVAERTAELSHRNQELKEALHLLDNAQDALLAAEKMASIGRLLAGIAHEINNPINAVVNTAEPLRDSLHELSAHLEHPTQAERPEIADLQRMLDVLCRGARRTREIVLALHNYARGGSDIPVSVDLSSLINEALELVQHPFFGQVEIVRNFAAKKPVISLGGQLQQVFVNLFSNAVHALAERAQDDKTLRPRLEISTQEDSSKNELCITVRDNGPGISQAVLPRIFEPFFSTKEASHGSGLGLSIVYGIVARHKGQIRVETTVGQGTCFTVLLPLKS